LFHEEQHEMKQGVPEATHNTHLAVHILVCQAD